MHNGCFHCDLAIPDDQNHSFKILNQSRSFCCFGCLAIAETISQNGLEDFYRFRTEPSQKAQQIIPQELHDFETLDNQAVLQSISLESSENTGHKTIILGIEGITCAACGWLIKKQLKHESGVRQIEVNITTRRANLVLDHDAKISPILKRIRKLGYRAYPFNEQESEKSIKKEDNLFIRRLIVAGIAMMQVMMFSTGLYIGEFQDISQQHAYFLHLVSGLFATVVVVYSAQAFFISALNSLKQGQFGMNLPVSIAILSAYLSSIYSLFSTANVYYFDSVVMFSFFLLLGRFLEHRMRYKAILKQQNFNQLLPLSVNKKNHDGSTSVILINDIKPGDQLIINAGAVVPVDGVLVDATAELNEAILTGEFMPVSKTTGDSIISGSSNNSSGFVIQATSSVSNSRLHELIRLQNTSSNLIGRSESLADRIANWYTILLLLTCSFTAVFWWYLDPTNIFPVVLSMLVVTCPCALSLATPAAEAAAVSQLTDKGLMLRNQNTLSNLAKIEHVFFDKTGTLTLGKMSLIQTIIHGNLAQNECLKIAKSLETISNHPLAQTFNKLAIQPYHQIDNQEFISGGVSATIQDNQYKLGKASFVATGESVLIALNNQQKLANPSETQLFLTRNNQHIATFVLKDELNKSAQNCITQLQNNGYKITMISGDSSPSCQATARKINIKNIIANATPEQKLAEINRCQKQGHNILMIGDGVNDIGALAAANVSFTMGSASHLSRDASDAVIVSHDLTLINDALLLAKKLKKIIRQNLTWAVIYNITALPFAMAGLVPAWAAVIGMTSSSLIVVLNALRLRK